MVETNRAPQDVVAHGYDRVAEEYAALEGEHEWPRMRWLREVLAQLPRDSRVLDLGCGSGVPATLEIARKHLAIGVDVSARQIALARENVPSAEFTEADVLALEFPAHSFGAVVAFYVLDHLPREQHGALLRRTWTWLTPGGLLLFTVETEDTPDTTSRWLGVDMFFSCYDEETTRRMVLEADFEMRTHAVESQLEGTRDVSFLWVLAAKPAESG